MKWCSHETYIRLCVVYFIVMLLLLLSLLLLLLPLPRCVLFFSFSFSRSSSSLFHLITVFRLPYWFVGNACVSKLLLGNCSHGTMFMHLQWCASSVCASFDVCVSIHLSIHVHGFDWIISIQCMRARSFNCHCSIAWIFVRVYLLPAYIHACERTHTSIPLISTKQCLLFVFLTILFYPPFADF